MDFGHVLNIIKNFFGNSTTLLNHSRKRRAEEPMDRFTSPKCRKLYPTTSRDFSDDRFMNRNPIRRPSILKISPRVLSPRPSGHIDTIVLDDDDDKEIKKLEDTHLHNIPREKKFTSTPENHLQRHYTNGISDDDVAFIKETKSPREKQTEALKHGLNYIKPFSSRILSTNSTRNGTKPKDKSLLLDVLPKRSRPSIGSTTLNYSVRMDDKMQYKKLLEQAGSTSTINDSSIYHTPVGNIFNYGSLARNAKTNGRSSLEDTNNKTYNSKGRMLTKDRIQKVLDDFDNEPVVVKDSDSDSDVIFQTPPSPKPDIKVERVNSLKRVIDTCNLTKKEYVDELVDQHRNIVNERQREIDQLRECSEKHGKINKELRWELLTDQINKSLLIKDAILPVEEKEEEIELPELTQTQLKMVERAFRGSPNEVLIQKFNLSITRRDLLTLAGLNWLNDEVINFYMNLIIERGKDSRWPKAYAFNTFFYSKLIKDGPQSLRRWTKKIDLFAHDIIAVPIHLGMHWCMAIIDFRDKSIRYYDSMGSSNNKCLVALKHYLETEHLDKKKAEYDTSDYILENVGDIPQQMNGSDCGMFSCTFAEFLTRDAKITFNQEIMPYLRKKMVVEILSGELLIR